MAIDDEILTIPETAKLLRISTPQAYKMARNGDIPVWRPAFSPNIVRVPRRLLMEKIERESLEERTRPEIVHGLD